MSLRSLLRALAIAFAAGLLAVTPAAASRHVLIGLLDDANTLGDPGGTFPVLVDLHVQVVRMTLNWRLVAQTQPASARDPLDPAYSWGRVDAAVQTADAAGIKVLLTIFGTPGWANGGQAQTHAPVSAQALQDFAFAAATHFATVKLWLAWNEPNNPIDLAPQYLKHGKKWVLASPAAYAKICTAVYTGVHQAAPDAKVGCGATAPRGNDQPAGARPSVDPLAFLRGVKLAGLKRFDAWAHHPYYGSVRETPTSRPPASQHAIELGNIDVLTKELTRLYGPKRVWITEYGYQTNPPDSFFGVSWAKQALYLSQAFTIARQNPRIDLMTWFLLKDDIPLGGWQSGLLTADNRKKPAYRAFQHLSLGVPVAGLK
jgi:Cellulase (glycosyl hydrolase family 5)